MDNINNDYLIETNELHESDECFHKGLCSVNPNLFSVHEVILLYLKELSFYMLKLKDFGATNETIKETVIYALFNILTNAEYNQEEFHTLISNLYDYIQQSKILYEKACLERNIEIITHKSYFKYTKNFDLTDAIRKGEKYFLKKMNTFTSRQKDLYDIVLFLIKSLSLKIIELQSLEAEYDDVYYTVLGLLNIINPGEEFSAEKTKQQIETTMEIYHEAVQRVFTAQVERYGDITPTEVSFSTEPGKAILVSGSDLAKLELVLHAVENTEINVYTHGLEMLMAHAFPKLRSHPNLKGHFGFGLESSLIDFASFPGAILMTKATLQRFEYLYRGRLFTLDPISSPGVMEVKDNNFDHLIKSALEAKGFSHATHKPPMKVGFSEKEMKQKINTIIEQIVSKKIRHLYIIGLLNASNLAYKQYFEKFFELMPKDCYAISMSYPIHKENVFHLDSFYDYSLLYKILEEIAKIQTINQLDMSIFLTKCDKHTISNLLYLKYIGVKNVYMCKCPISLINPTLIQTLREIFGIEEITEPKKDLQDTSG